VGPKIIQDVALNEELHGGTLVLQDINGEALEDMYQWGTRALDEARADLKLEKTLRLEEALRGTDFVILGISTGGLDATALDLPARSGICRSGLSSRPTARSTARGLLASFSGSFPHQ
jgi:alpha-galactosidase/6-phospho-beta-glucosidase family protein